MSLVDYAKQIGQPDDSKDINIFTFAALFSYTSSVFLASALIVWLAVVFPWGGTLASKGSFAFLFYLTVAVSLYAFAHGYIDIFKRGLSSWCTLLWSAAIVVSLGVTIDIVVFGSTIVNAPITFSGSDFLMSPNVFFTFVTLQAVYFLYESIRVSFSTLGNGRGMENWYRALYLFVLALNTASVILGLLIMDYYQMVK